MLSFQTPASFLLILLIPLFYILRHAGFFKKLTVPANLGDWGSPLFNWHDPKRRLLHILSTILVNIAFTLVVFAFADPVIYRQEKIYTTLGTDIIFVIDTSPSMAATESDGHTRLESCKEAVNQLSQNNSGSRLGIVAMGSQAAVVVPPTMDHQLFSSRLASIENGVMGDGTAIGTGISTAVYHLISSKAPRKVIILITDGENNAGEVHPETAAALCLEHDISLYILGVGSRGSVPIDYTDPVTGKTYSGLLSSDFDSASLKKIALAGNGRYFELVSLAELSKGLSKILNDESVSQNWTYKTRYSSYFDRCLLWALLAFALSIMIKRLFLNEVV